MEWNPESLGEIREIPSFQKEKGDEKVHDYG